MPADLPSYAAGVSVCFACQTSRVPTLHWAGKDGPVQGAVYGPHESKAGGSWSNEKQASAAVEEARRTGVMRSYGSMTYAMIKSFIYLDVQKDDRLQSALNWAKHHYQFEVNPGMPEGQEKQGYSLLSQYVQIVSSC